MAVFTSVKIKPVCNKTPHAEPSSPPNRDFVLDGIRLKTKTSPDAIRNAAVHLKVATSLALGIFGGMQKSVTGWLEKLQLRILRIIHCRSRESQN